MSTDSHGPGPQGNAGGGAAEDGDVDGDAPPPPKHAGARGRPTPDRRSGGRSAPPRRRRKARRVHRVVHHLDIWSLAKVASIFVLCAYVVGLVSGFLLWRAADRVGTIDGIEGFMEDTGGYDSFVLKGSVVFSSALVIGLILGVLTICLIVLTGILFNLISDLTGGIRMTVIDEDLIVTPARRGRPAPPRSDERPAPPRSPDAPTGSEAPATEPKRSEGPAEPTSPDVAASSPSPGPKLEIDFG